MRFLSGCGFFRGETPYLREWLEFHRLVGFEHFYLLDNDGGDEAAAVLRPYTAAGLVTLIPWLGGPALRRQLEGYAFVCRMARSEWVAFFDLDEFFVPAASDDIPSLLHRRREVALAANWLVFGSGGHQAPQPLQIDAYRRCAPADHPLNRQVKCIVRPRWVAGVSCPHIFHFPGGMRPSDMSGRVVMGNDHPADHSVWRVNHYRTRSRRDWEAKAAKWLDSDPSQPKGGTFFEDNDRNECLDEDACRFLPALRGRLGLTAVEATGGGGQPGA